MIGPFDCWTTARSGERAGAAGTAWTAFSVDSFPEHPASNVVTDAARTARPKSLRLRPARDSLLGASLAHGAQLVELQVPQALAEPPITLSNLSMVVFPF